jgi:hypothetical protein
VRSIGGRIRGSPHPGRVRASWSARGMSREIDRVIDPTWWWAVPHPHENYAVLNLGIYTVTSTSLALVTTAIGLALAPVAIALNRRIASGHARAARSALEG